MMSKQGFHVLLLICLVAFIIAFVPLCLHSSQSARADDSEVEYWAVIVGVAEYQVGFRDTIYSDEDAVALAAKLAPIWGEDNIRLLINSEATKDNIEKAVREWLSERVSENDVVLFYYSGHGNFKYVCPYDLRYGGNPEWYLWASDLARWLRLLDTDNIAVILDSCYSGSFIGDLSRPGLAIMTSSRGTQKSFAFTSLNHGAFTNYLLEAFDNFQDADTDRNYEISFEEIFEYASPRTSSLVERFGNTQEPQIDYRYDGDLGIFYAAILNTNLKITSLTVDGMVYESHELPATFRWKPGSSHDIEVSSSVPTETGVQYRFTSWSDGNTSALRTISSGGEYTANYMTQYYLTLESEYGNPSGEGWYYDGTDASIYVSSPVGAIARKVCTGWSGDINISTPQSTVYMDSPMTVVANWRNDYSQLYLLIGGIVGVTAIGSGFFMRRRRIQNRMPVVVDVNTAEEEQPSDTDLNLPHSTSKCNR